jgi:CheY-like chemotaxis protein
VPTHNDIPLVFVSCCKKDRGFVDELAAKLRDLNLNPWIFYEHQETGDWRDKAARAISDCVGFILVTSRNSISPTSWVKDEWINAQQQFKDSGETKPVIIPILLDDSKPFAFSERHHAADFRESREYGFEQLTAMIVSDVRLMSPRTGDLPAVQAGTGNHLPERPRAFVLEDRKLTRMLLKQTLERIGFDVWMTSTLAEAHTILDERNPRFHLAIVDLHVEGSFNGTEIVKKCATVLSSRQCRKVILTGHPFRMDEQRKGTWDFIAKGGYGAREVRKIATEVYQQYAPPALRLADAEHALGIARKLYADTVARVKAQPSP